MWVLISSPVICVWPLDNRVRATARVKVRARARVKVRVVPLRNTDHVFRINPSMV